MLGCTVWDILAIPHSTEFPAQLYRASVEQHRNAVEWTSPEGRSVQVYVLPCADSIALLLRDNSVKRTATRGRTRRVSTYPGLFRAHDVTERNVLESCLIEAQKMEVAGQLVFRVAHDFSNLLTVMLSSADMLLADPANRALVQTRAEELKHAALRGSALTRQLLASNRREALRPIHVELNAVVAREERVLRPLLGSQVQLRVAPDDDAGTIYADPDQLGQVLVNLVVNARDAMPNGGTITIETDAMSVRPQDGPRWHGLAPGAYTALVVSDTGIGMDEATKARIFEPFFTTKDPGRGTGLGLAIVSDVVRESGGTMLVESTPGRGSAFIIYWPSAKMAA
jgi:signal transduction histidine kinase